MYFKYLSYYIVKKRKHLFIWTSLCLVREYLSLHFILSGLVKGFSCNLSVARGNENRIVWIPPAETLHCQLCQINVSEKNYYKGHFSVRNLCILSCLIFGQIFWRTYRKCRNECTCANDPTFCIGHYLRNNKTIVATWLCMLLQLLACWHVLTIDLYHFFTSLLCVWLRKGFVLLTSWNFHMKKFHSWNLSKWFLLRVKSSVSARKGDAR